ERSDGAAGAGLRVLPRHAGMLAAPGQDLAHGRASDSEIGLGGRLRRGRVQSADLIRVVLLRQHVIELIGEAAAAGGQPEQAGSSRQAARQRVPSARRSSITGLPKRRARRQHQDGMLRRMSESAPIEHPSWLTSGDFTEADEPLRLFAAWFEEAARSEPRDPTAMSLASVDADGLPNVRMVLMKGFDERGWVFFTNVDSQKVLQ